MRIVVSGTHASGKSTLISDFALSHPEYTVLPDPFELLDEASDAPGAAAFAAQLGVAARRLTREAREPRLIAERGPVDFLAYLLATSELNGTPLDHDFLRSAIDRTSDALRSIDLLVVLPLSDHDAIRVEADEHPALRHAMNDALLDLVDDPDIVHEGLEVLELSGTPAQRLRTPVQTVDGR